jgi:sugar lactone lactonase YvrE
LRPSNIPAFPAANLSRRQFAAVCAAAGGSLLASGCGKSEGSGHRPEKVWGVQGIIPGRLHRPRGITIDQDDLLYIVDITARIQVFDGDGKYLRGWRTPEAKNGRPTGLSVIDGKLYVPDTHYFRVLVYTLDGQLLEEESFGEEGAEGGKFGWPTDVAKDSQGNIYVAEYGQHDRIQKFSPDRRFLKQWGSHGNEPGLFLRPQSLCIDRHDQIWVADATNHRLQVFDTEGNFKFQWGQNGQEGIEPGQFSYPYGVIVDTQDQVYVCEFGNSRVQKLSPEGESLGIWGAPGRAPGELHNPWAIVKNSRGKLFVLDTYNHRVQRFTL